MTVRLKNGAEYREGLFTHPGNPSHMFTRDEFDETFRAETAHVLAQEETDEIIQTVRSLEKAPDAAVLAEKLFSRTAVEVKP